MTILGFYREFDNLLEQYRSYEIESTQYYTKMTSLLEKAKESNLNILDHVVKNGKKIDLTDLCAYVDRYEQEDSYDSYEDND